MLFSPQIIPGAAGVIPTLRNCFGYYDADEIGPNAPLVGYAGTYTDDTGFVQKHYVGKKFYNFAMAEQWTDVLSYWAFLIRDNHFNGSRMATFLGMPMGGILFAHAMAGAVKVYGPTRCIYAEKRVTALATEGQREQSQFEMSRHIILPEEEIWLAEDVVNNLSSPGKAKPMIENAGAVLKGIVSVINRSNQTEWKGLPIISALHLPTEQWEQEDPEVAEKVAAGNVIWKPKDVWMDQLFPMLSKAA
jgi:orotate phosphoribosyltransferase